jgi:hypothetical protein
VKVRPALNKKPIEKRGTLAGAKDLVPIWAFEVHPLNLNVSKWCSKPRNPTPFSEHWVRAESPYRRTFGKTLNPVTHSSKCVRSNRLQPVVQVRVCVLAT